SCNTTEQHLTVHCRFFFLFTATAPSALYTLSLHDALPIFDRAQAAAELGGDLLVGVALHLAQGDAAQLGVVQALEQAAAFLGHRSEEHTSELQSRFDLVCRLLLEKKKRSAHAGVRRPLQLV